jgi:hypothetical protein
MSQFRERPAREQLKYLVENFRVNDGTIPRVGEPEDFCRLVWRPMKHSRKGLAGEFLDGASRMELSRLLGSVKL